MGIWTGDGFNFYIIKIGVCFIYLRNDLVALLLCDNFLLICKMNSLFVHHMFCHTIFFYSKTKGFTFCTSTFKSIVRSLRLYPLIVPKEGYSIVMEIF